MWAQYSLHVQLIGQLCPLMRNNTDVKISKIKKIHIIIFFMATQFVLIPWRDVSVLVATAGMKSNGLHKKDQ